MSHYKYIKETGSHVNPTFRHNYMERIFNTRRFYHIDTRQILHNCSYFDVPDENLTEFKARCENFIERTKLENKCLYYGFSFNGNQVHCREGYADAEGLLERLSNVGQLLHDALEISEISRLEVHGPESELSKIKEPLADLNPDFYILEYGFRR